MPSYSNHKYYFMLLIEYLLVAGILIPWLGYKVRINTIFFQDYLASIFIQDYLTYFLLSLRGTEDVVQA